MEHQLYAEMDVMERTHWWFIGRRRVIFDVIGRLAPRPKSALDIGCGTGMNLEHLVATIPQVKGLEMSEEAIRFSRQRLPGVEILQGSLPDNALYERFDLITLFDVLEHIENDDAALRAIRKMLSSQGRLVLTVPAHMYLWTEHDELFHHKRRYTAANLRAVLEKTGYRIERLSYFNTVMFLPIILFRAMRRLLGLREGASDFFVPSAPLNRFLSWSFGLECYPLRWMDMPFGVSLIAVATPAVSDDQARVSV